MKNKKIIITVVAVVVFIAIAAGAGILSSYLINKDSKTGNVVAVTEDFNEDTLLLERLARHPERYTDNLINEYKMSADKANEFYDCPEEWLVYGQSITIYNNTADNITVYGFEVENNGKNGVYLSTSTGGELAIAPGGNGPASISVLCENGDLTTDEAKALVSDFKVKVIFSKTPTEFDDGTESTEETKTAVLELAE